MADVTKIAWTDSTFNGWIGCTKVGPGCDNCYAEAGNHRFYAGMNWGPGAPRRLTTQQTWRKPFLWNERAGLAKKRHLVFCSSQADVFDNEVPVEWRASLFRLIEKTPHLTWQLLTKRIGNVPKMILEATNGAWEGSGLPRNIWLGATMVNQEEVDRDLPKLRMIPATVRFISIEPQLSQIDMREHFGMWWNGTMNCYEAHGAQFKRPVDWIINGGESAQFGRCRPYELDWGRLLMRQCRAAGVAFFMKQLGSDASDHGNRQLAYMGKGDDPSEWPEELRVQEFPA